MRIRVRELRNVLRRVIAENDMSFDDLDDMEDSPIDDMAEEEQDAIQDAIRQAFEAGLGADDIIDLVSADYPGVPIEMIEDMVNIEAEVDNSESVTGPSSFRPSLVQAHAPSIVTRAGGYN